MTSNIYQKATSALLVITVIRCKISKAKNKSKANREEVNEKELSQLIDVVAVVVRDDDDEVIS